MRLVAKLTAVLVLLLPPVRVAALDSSKTIAQYHHVVWGPEQGLEGFSVNDILETRDGYIWIATDEGLARFNEVAPP